MRDRLPDEQLATDLHLPHDALTGYRDTELVRSPDAVLFGPFEQEHLEGTALRRRGGGKPDGGSQGGTADEGELDFRRWR